MPVLVFDKLNNIVLFEQWKFPGGEIGIKLPVLSPNDSFTVVTKGIPTSDDFIVVCNILDAMHRFGIPKENVKLQMKYLPYARQDRKCHEGESFALSVFLRLLSSMQYTFNELEVHDVHSEVAVFTAMKFFNEGFKFNTVNQSELAVGLPEFDVIIAPDAGSVQKASAIQPNAEHIFLDKVRQNGKVLYSDYPYDTIEGSACVVDDICDGGATFIAVAEMLKRTQPRLTKLNLYVTHGIFSRGLEVLWGHFDEIYVSNPMTNTALNATII